MNVMVDFCLIPIGAGVSLSPYIARAVAILKERGLEIERHAYGTTIQGGWDEVFDAIKACFEVVHQEGVPRVHATLKVGTRTDRAQTMADKVASVAAKLEGAGACVTL